MFKFGVEGVPQIFLKLLKTSWIEQIVIPQKFAAVLDNGSLENISKLFLNNSVFELGRVCHPCGARNYCFCGVFFFLYVGIFLPMTTIQLFCSKCIHFWAILFQKWSETWIISYILFSLGGHSPARKGSFPEQVQEKHW